MNELVATEEKLVSVPVHDSDVDGLLRLYQSGAVSTPLGKLRMINMPTEQGRARLAARMRKLSASLKEHDRKQIALHITAMLKSYRNAIRPNESARDVVATYLQELGRIGDEPAIPTWAVVLACNAIRRGDAPGIRHDFPPSTVQLRVLAKGYLDPWLTEVASISRVLDGEKFEPEQSVAERQRIGGLLADLGERLKARLNAERAEASARMSERAGEAMGRRLAEIQREWGSDPVPTIAGIPVSRELAQRIRRECDATRDAAAEYAIRNS
jgi:hypothetical protein